MSQGVVCTHVHAFHVCANTPAPATRVDTGRLWGMTCSRAPTWGHRSPCAWPAHIQNPHLHTQAMAGSPGTHVVTFEVTHRELGWQAAWMPSRAHSSPQLGLLLQC